MNEENNRNSTTQALKDRLSIANEVIAEQDSILQAMLRSNSNARAPDADAINASSLAIAAEDLEMEKRHLATKLQNMENERLAFLERAKELDHDRVEFEVDRINLSSAHRAIDAETASVL